MENIVIPMGIDIGVLFISAFNFLTKNMTVKQN